MLTGIDRIVVPASAKINLFLEILGVRDNGYHDLRSVLVPVSLHDELTLENTDGPIETVIDEGGSVDCDVLRGKGADRNLATRAADLLRRTTGYPGGVRIGIKKNIPIGGGLGGGSADAAAVLKGLNRLWGLGLSGSDLSGLGASIGCDVPALVYGGLVLVEGLGEKVTPLSNGHGDAIMEGSCRCGFPEWWLVLANPGFNVSTADIYSRCSEPLTSSELSAKRMVYSLQDRDVEEVSKSLFNGLQQTVFRKYPLIEMVAEALTEAGSVGTLLSGSGASVFGLARDEAHARCVAECLRGRMGPTVWCKVVRTLPDGVTVAHGPLEA